MDLKCFVQILPVPGFEGTGGTGYLISGDRVLTARHVVGEAKAVTIRYDNVDDHEPGSAGVVEVPKVEVRWRGEGDCDMALLVLPEAVGFPLTLPRLADTELTTATPWESRGWALAAAEAERVRDSMVDVLGEASAFLPDQHRSQLTVDPKPQRIDNWKGISGAPVFERGSSRRLLGVIAEAPRAFENVLKASPITAALRQPAFREALGSKVARERRDRLIRDLISLLEDEPAAARAIADRKDSWRERFGGGNVRALVDELLAGTDAAEVLGELDKAHARLWRQGPEAREAAGAIEEVVARLGPLLIQRGLLHALPEGTGGVLLRLPVATPTFAELAVAVFDGRPSRLGRQRGDHPAGRGVLTAPPEPGIDPDGRQLLSDLAADLERRFLVTSERERLERLRRMEPDGHDRAREMVLRLADAELAFQADHAEEALRHYLLYDRQFASDHARFLDLVAEHLPSIHRVEMTSEDLVRERLVCRLLDQLLGRRDALLEKGET